MKSTLSSLSHIYVRPYNPNFSGNKVRRVVERFPLGWSGEGFKYHFWG